ncbi:hypothetical protein JNW90_05530 [Micromonospora sp. STR1s_5]|nr:hypothetical protein [Micromonospora sp. STR1s_5]
MTRPPGPGGGELLAAKPPPGTGADESEKEYVEYTYVESPSAAEQGRLWAYVELPVYEAVRAGVPVFGPRLTHPDPGVRTGAAYALAWFPEEADGSVSSTVIAAATRGLALRQLSPRHEDRAFDALLDRLPTVSGERSLTALGVALRLAF